MNEEYKKNYWIVYKIIVQVQKTEKTTPIDPTVVHQEDPAALSAELDREKRDLMGFEMEEESLVDEEDHV